MKLIDKVALLYIRDRRILSTRSRGKDVWYLPGGKREGSESDQECLTREILEELNVNMIQDSLKYFDTYSAQAHGKAEGITVQMTCYAGDFTGDLQASSEIEEYDWIVSTIDTNLLSPVDRIILADLHAKNLID